MTAAQRDHWAVSQGFESFNDFTKLIEDGIAMADDALVIGNEITAMLAKKAVAS